MLGVQLQHQGLTTASGESGGQPLRILCIGAHSDDIEIGAAGTILSLTRCNPNVHVDWIVCSASQARVKEATDSADELLSGACSYDIRFLGLRENYFNYGPEVKESFEAVRSSLSCQPELIFTHSRHDRHQDHETVSRLTWNTWRDHLILEYEIPKVDGDLRTPNVYVPLSEASVNAKIDHLDRNFSSQRSKRWYDRDTFHGLLRLRGIECQSPTRFAEAFHGRKMVLALDASDSISRSASQDKSAGE